MSDAQRPFFDRQHPATDAQRPWIEEVVMSSERADDAVAQFVTWAVTERDYWWGKNADRHQQMNRVLCRLGPGRDPALTELVAAAREWRDVIGGTLTVPPQAYLDVECRLASAVDAMGAPE